VYECELIYRYGVDFDKVATTRLIAAGLSLSTIFPPRVSICSLSDGQEQQQGLRLHS